MYPTGPAARVVVVGLGKPDEVDLRRPPACGLDRREARTYPWRASRRVPPGRRSERLDLTRRRRSGDRRGVGARRLAIHRDEEAGGREEARARAGGCPRSLRHRSLHARTPDRRGHRRRADAGAWHSGVARQHLHAGIRGTGCLRDRCAPRHIGERSRQGGHREGTDGRAPGSGTGQCGRAALHRAGVQGRRRGAGRPDRQRRHVRHRRHLDQARGRTWKT